MDDTTTCPGCHETYCKNKRIPLFLPCTHTVCQECVNGYTQERNYVICPECRKKHRVTNEAKSFPENKYILKILHLKSESQQFGLCQQHPSKALILFCEDEACEKAICLQCLKEDHKGHTFLELQEENKKAKEEFARLHSEVTTWHKKLTAAKHKLQETNNINVSNLLQKKKEVEGLFNKIQAYIDLLNKKQMGKLDEKLCRTSRNLRYLTRKKTEIDSGRSGHMSKQELRSLQEIYRDDFEVSFKSFSCQVYEFSEKEIEWFYSHVWEMDETIHVLAQTDSSVKIKLPTCIPLWSEVKVLSDDTLLFQVCQDHNHLKKYSMDGQIISALDMGVCHFGRDVCHILDITLNGRLCIAVTKNDRIDFLDAQNFVQICSFPCLSGTVCRVLPSTLLYVERSYAPSYVKWLDCSSIPPKPASFPNIKVLQKKYDSIVDMCCASDEKGSLLLVLVFLNGSLLAYDAKSGKVKWRFTERTQPDKVFYMSAITADEQGHFFAYDQLNFNQPGRRSRAVHIFSMTGEHLGTILEDKQHLFKGHPVRLEWNKRMSSLVISRTVDDECIIDFVKIEL